VLRVQCNSIHTVALVGVSVKHVGAIAVRVTFPTALDAASRGTAFRALCRHKNHHCKPIYSHTVHTYIYHRLHSIAKIPLSCFSSLRLLR